MSRRGRRPERQRRSVGPCQPHPARVRSEPPTLRRGGPRRHDLVRRSDRACRRVSSRIAVQPAPAPANRTPPVIPPAKYLHRATPPPNSSTAHILDPPTRHVEPSLGQGAPFCWLPIPRAKLRRPADRVSRPRLARSVSWTGSHAPHAPVGADGLRYEGLSARHLLTRRSVKPPRHQRRSFLISLSSFLDIPWRTFPPSPRS